MKTRPLSINVSPPTTGRNASADRRFDGIFLAGILVAALLIRVVLAVTVPAWDAPDEYAHYWYIEQIADQGRLPVGTGEFPNYEAFQPPLYYLLASSLMVFGDESVSSPQEKLPPSRTLIVLRLFSVILGLATIAVSYRLFGMISGLSHIRLWCTAFIAFLPAYVGVTSTVNNDALLVLLSTLCLYFLMKDSWSGRTALWIGLIAGAALLTKMNALILCPIVLIRAYQVADYRCSKSAKLIAIAISGWSIGVALLLARNVGLYGELSVVNPGVDTGWGGELPNIIRATRNLVWSFWYAFGRMYRAVPSATVYLLTVLPLMILALAGWVRICRQHYSLLVIIIGAVLVSVAGSLLYTLSYPPGVMTSWGKNLYPILPLIALFIAGGWYAVLKRRPWITPAAGIIILVAGCFLAIFSS